jgi:hypothetical protein
MTLHEAKALVRRYLGSFPSLNLHDPEIYIADLCALLCGYPLWAGQNAIEEIKDTNKFPATRAEIRPLLDEQVRIPKFVRDWEQQAQVQIASRHTLAIEGPAAPPRLTYEQLRAKYDGPNGEKWGIENTDKPLPSRERSRKALIDRYGKEAFDAVPRCTFRRLAETGRKHFT